MSNADTKLAGSARSPWLFFLFSSVLITPLFILDIFVPKQIIPGVPLAGLGIFCPVLAACLLSYGEGGLKRVKALLMRAFDFKRITGARWYAAILLTLPLATIVSLAIQAARGDTIPPFETTLLPFISLCIGFFVGAIGEELGWSGYATEPLQNRWGELKAALIIGAFGAIYHYMGLLHVGRSIEWIMWWTVYAIATRIIMVKIFNHTGRSVFGMILFHMMINVTWQLYPVNGSSFDPQVAGLVLAFFAVAFVIADRRRTHK
jgi:membrane protease YdiL (CAAX protease family)